MNILARELKANIRSLFVWAGIIVLFAAAGFSKFAAYEGNAELVAVLDAMPAPLLVAFSMQAFNLTTLTGFYAVMIAFYGLLLSIAAVLWGSTAISKEQRDRTVEFSLTLPVTRAAVVTAKTLAALVNCLGLLLITWLVTWVGTLAYQPDGRFYRFLALSMVPLLVLQLVFLAVGVLLGCTMRRYRRASSVAVSVLLAAYFLSVVSELRKDWRFLKYLSPFRYFDVRLLLHESRVDLKFVGISAGIIGICLAVAYISYARRDLYI